MLDFQLTDNASLKTIAFRIKDNYKMVDFYKNIVGLTLKSEENGLSIFSSGKNKNQVLILEEGETFDHSTVHFSVCLSSEEEWLGIVNRFSEHSYPIKKKEIDGDKQELVIVDPEMNEIEFYYQRGQQEDEQKEDTIIKAEEVDGLEEEEPEAGTVVQISLNTMDIQSSKEFYEQVLGLTSIDETTLSLGSENVVFQLLEKAHLGSRADLGWNFFVVDLDGKEEIEKLMYHLEQKKQDFFIDNKRSILTVFDINGIEWWFTKNRV
ncbi:VOC family protein [Enterococcus sp. BWR-S5]|uniref:VOC family protein n=1 Tax=Enterococcus sp. BWR-S5 TaxID=2787714 RepID=UPI0019244B61|nr:VOC family protein [Enterococcus sp. BWR-S5]MBL1226462.1 VOC family protein [Enterococcus sp. BWR-S5]